MLIDIVFLLFMLIALLKGLRQGLVIAVFSMVAFVIGLAAAIKLSDTVAGWLKDSMQVSARWLPVLAFLLVFLAVVLLVRWAAKLIEAALDLAMIGWLNKLAGFLLYAVLYTLVLSVLLFYGVQMRIISDHTIDSSRVYPFVRSWGPAVIDELGKFLPFFRGMFTRLEDFFGRLANRP